MSAKNPMEQLGQDVMLLVDAAIWWKLGSPDPGEVLDGSQVGDGLEQRLDGLLHSDVWRQVKHDAADAIQDHIHEGLETRRPL